VTLSLDEYQRRAAETDVDQDSNDPLVPLLGLTGEVGALAAEFKKQQRADTVHYTGFDDGVATELGDILWYLAALARRTGLGLEDIALRNLSKTASRWLAPTAARPDFDSDFPPDQRLPRDFEVRFTSAGGRIQMSVNGEAFGDAIDDNSRVDDFYRFHDVFHVAYAAVLGWSPIFRSLLGRKRKLDEVTDRVEDGARARATEEAVAALVFKMAHAYNYFEGQRHVDDSILGAITCVVSGLEVGDRSKAEWERAILVGFEVWRQLRDHEQGVVAVDVDAGTLTFRP
jgi:NTP pyrophosphatase (non-canonical NTP hydrolase)